MARQIHFDLVRDVLDKQLHDVNGCPFGKVDGILLEFASDAPPRIACIETGGVTAVHRLPHWLRRMVEPFVRKYGAQHGAPMIVPWENVVEIDLGVVVDFDASETQALHWERAAHRI